MRRGVSLRVAVPTWLLSVSVAACDDGRPTTNEPPDQSSTVAASGTSTSGSDSETAPVPPVANNTEPTSESPPAPIDVEIGPGPFFLQDPGAGLDQLKSYTSALTVSFNGTADGKPAQWTKSFTLRHIAEPSASVLEFGVTGDAKLPALAFLAESNAGSYVRAADGSCEGRPRRVDSFLGSNDPVALLPSLLGAEQAGSGEVNGIASNHYTFDARALLESGGPETTGEVWVSSAGGYVVRFLRTTKADASYFGGGLAGEMKWDYELTDVDGLTGLAMPEGCQLDAPVLVDAANLVILPDFLTYDSASSVSDVVAFYNTTLGRAGWAPSADSSTQANSALADFTKDGTVLHVIVTKGDSRTRVAVAAVSDN